MSDTPKFDFREWLSPLLLLPIFFDSRIAAVAVLQR
jgi:hypothetical protein